MMLANLFSSKGNRQSKNPAFSRIRLHDSKKMCIISLLRCRDGGTGRRTGLKIPRRKAFRFDSGSRHQTQTAKPVKFDEFYGLFFGFFLLLVFLTEIVEARNRSSGESGMNHTASRKVCSGGCNNTPRKPSQPPNSAHAAPATMPMSQTCGCQCHSN